MILLEANLPDLLIDLYDNFGNVYPVPNGRVVQITVIVNKCTYQKALERLVKVLVSSGIPPLSLVISPDETVRGRVNRKVTFGVRASEVTG